MANIATEIKNFLSAIYGKDVRASLVSLAEKLNHEVENNTVTANNAANSANEAAENANGATERANTAAAGAEEAISNANTAADNANEAAEKAKNVSTVVLQEEVDELKDALTQYLPSNKVNFVGNAKEINVRDDSEKTFIQVMSENNLNALHLEYNKINKGYYINRKENGAWLTSKALFGEHNKPSGHYVGNGDATKRQIQVGGIGNTLHIYNASTGWDVLVGVNGAYGWCGTEFVHFKPTECRFISGLLEVASTHVAINSVNAYWHIYELL